MAKKMTTKAKILLASILVGVILVGAIISIVLVLAAQEQDITTNISLSYEVEGVTGNIKFSYALKGDALSTPLEAEIVAGDESGELSPANPLIMTASKDFLILKYEITALSGMGYYISLQYRDTKVADKNAMMSYAVSNTEISDFDSSSFVQTVPVGTLIANSEHSDEETVYFYVKVAIDNVTDPMNFDGGYVLSITDEAWTDPNTDANGIKYGYVENQGGNAYFAAVGYGGSSASVAVPNSVTLGGQTLPVVVIADYAFASGTSGYASTTSLSSITIGANVTTIGKFAFANNSGIQSITIPSTVKSVGKNVLQGCTGVTSITCPIFADTDGTKHLFGSLNSTVEQNLTVSMNGISSTVAENQVKKIVIPSTVESVSNGVLSAYTNLEYLEFPNILSDFSYWFGEPGATYAPIPTTLKTVVVNSGTEINQTFFQYKTNIETIKLADSITTIGDYAFMGCTGLKAVKLPSSLSSLSSGAFSGCTSLKEVIIPNTVSHIYSSAFSGCTSLKEIDIPSSVTYIEGGVFANSGIEKFVVKSGVTYDVMNGGDLFMGAPLKEVIFENGVTSVQYAMFSGCSSLETVKLSSTVTGIVYDAFNGCTNLKNIDLSKVQSIGLTSFKNCSSLTTINISSATSVENGAFENTGVTSVTIPSGLTTLNAGVFKNTKITSITIPSTVNVFYEDVFADCANLEEINWQCGLVMHSNPMFAGAGSAGDGIVVNLTSSSVVPSNMFYNSDEAKQPNISKIVVPDGMTLGWSTQSWYDESATTTLSREELKNLPSNLKSDSTWASRWLYVYPERFEILSEVVNGVTKYFIELGEYPSVYGDIYDSNYLDTYPGLTKTDETLKYAYYSQGNYDIYTNTSNIYVNSDGDRFIRDSVFFYGSSGYSYFKLDVIKWDVLGYYTDSNKNTFVKSTDSTFDPNHKSYIVVLSNEIMASMNWEYRNNQEYDVDYETSNLKEWLNIFYEQTMAKFDDKIVEVTNSAIDTSSGSSSPINEKVWILDRNQINTFMTSDSPYRAATSRVFANNSSYWWTRDSLDDNVGGDYVITYAYYVDSSGSVSMDCGSNEIGMRPAMMVNL